jgi:SSS family solute:Na+ symporter
MGLAAGILTAALHHGLTLPVDDTVGLKGGWISVVHHYPSEMAQNFWTAIWAWTACFGVTILVSLVTRRRPDEALAGLTYSLTPKISEERGPWYTRPVVLGVIILTAVIALNILFR